MNEILITKLNKAYGQKIALRDFSAVIPKDRITCIMGPSGCGKTTLFRILFGLEKADSGTVSGMPLKFSAVFQEDRLLEDFSVLTNLRAICPRSVSDGEILACLESLRIGQSAHEKTSGLSGGMKRRVAIARALLAESEMIFMDEPFKGLDEETKAKVIQVLQQAGKPMAIITHDPDDAKLLGAEILQPFTK